MLVIRGAQMKVFGEGIQNRFEESLTEFLLANYPRECRQAGGGAAIGLFVRKGVASAARFGFTTRREVRLFANLMMMLGVDFSSDLQIPWAAAGLEPEAFPDPTLRCEQLFHAALAYLEATAGRQGESIVRAMLRVKALDLQTVPTTQDEAWAPGICAIWRRLYPEKFNLQGLPICLSLIEYAVPRAQAHRMKDPIGAFVHATLMFFLGTGYDHDPLHPWASAVLRDSSLPSGLAIGERLHAAALEHIEQSLTAS